MCCTRLAENTGRKNYTKIAIRVPWHNFVGLYLRNYGMYRQSEKCLLNPYNMVNFGLLTAEICWRVLGTPANFNRFHVLASLYTAPTSLNGGQLNFARCLAVSCAGILYIHFGGSCPPPSNGILPAAKFTLRPSLVFAYIGSVLYGTRGLGVSQFAAWYKEWNYGTFAEGAIYIRQGGHHVGNWPTF